MSKSAYFERYGFRDRLVDQPPQPGTAMIITIPAYREKELNKTLDSLRACHPPACSVEVLVLENHPDNERPEFFNKPDLSPGPAGLTIHLVRKALPRANAGVGLARKLVMDEAAWRLSSLDQADGLIVALDADCTVAPNYLVTLESFLMQAPAVAASIYYEHDLSGNYPPEILDAIAEYELHLRYYVHAQRRAGARFAFQTVGSAMVVRNEAYQSVGGMNKRKAGEDFYFLLKLMPHGFGEIRDTTVYPSPRISDRVPFGTGRAVAERLSSGRPRLTYSPESFEEIRTLYQNLPAIYEGSTEPFSPVLDAFLDRVSAREEWERIRSISPDLKTFSKHYHTWFDGFLLMKCLHYLRENAFPDIPVNEAAQRILPDRDQHTPADDTLRLLSIFRNLDRAI